MEAVVWHNESCSTPIIHMSLLASVHYKESLIWLKASVLCNTINTGPSMRVILDILFYPVLLRSCSPGSSGLAPPRALADHRWGICWGGPTHNSCSEPGKLQYWPALQFSALLRPKVSSLSLPWLVYPFRTELLSCPQSCLSHIYHQRQFYCVT